MMNIRHEAYKIILKVLTKNIFSDKLLSKTSKKIENSQPDAGLLYMLVKGVLKMKGNLDYIASIYTEEDKYSSTSIKIKILLYLSLYQLLYCDFIPEYAAVNESVTLAKKLYGENIANFINAVLRAYLRSKEIKYPENDLDRLALQYSFPKELVYKWLEYWSVSDTEKLCRYFNKIPELHIRINKMATDKSRLLEYFRRREIDVRESKVSDNILISKQTSEVLNNIAFSEGYYSIQDSSSALVVELLDPAPDESILDLFAGPGGKATYIAEMMENTGEIIAVDKFPQKIKKIKQAVERLQIKNMQIITKDSFKYGPVAPAFDKVLLDVPCTGWGVFQKKAELRWQLNQDLPKLLKLQENALKTGSAFVKKDGFMVYSTCTLNEEENERQISKFLKKNKNFKKIPASGTIPDKFVKKGFLKTLPYENNIDGAFAAKLKRIS